MGADSTAAAYLMDRQKAFDPMGAFAAGVQLQSNLQKISLAGQAGQIDTILNVVKLQNEQADQRRKDDLVKQQLSIASYNAETNRLNATRPKTGTDSGGSSAMSALRVGPNGQLLLDPSALGQPQGGATTAGQSDGSTVAPLVNGPQTPQVMPSAEPGSMIAGPPTQQDNQQAQQPGNLVAGMGQSVYTAPGMVGPNMPGQPQPRVASAPSGGQIAPNIGYGQQQAPAGMLPVSGITFTSRGPTVSVKSPDPNDMAGPQLTNAMLDSISRSVAHLGKRAVPTKGNTKTGMTEYVLEDIPVVKGQDFSVSSLPEKQQGEFLKDALDLGALAASAHKAPSDAEKMRAAGIVFPGDVDGREPTEEELKVGAGQMMVQKKDWNVAYGAAQKDKQNLILQKALEQAIKLNRAFAGKPGYSVQGPEKVLADLGFSGLLNPNGQPAPQGAPEGQQAFGLSGNNGAFSQGVRAASAAPTGTASVGSTRVASQPAPANDQNQVAALQNEIASMPQGKERQQKQNFLDSLQKQSAAKPGAPTSAAAPANQDPWTMAPKAEPVKLEDTSKRDAATQNWEKGKVDVVRALKKTLTAKEIADLQQSEPPADPERGGGTTTYEKQSTWLAEHGKELGLKPRDGKPLRMDSPIFVDHEGRTIYMRDIMRETFNDARFKATRESASQSQSGNTFKVTVGKPVEVK